MTSSTAHVALSPPQDPPSACPGPAASAASTDADGHENGASHCSHCLTAHLVVVRGAGILVMPPVPSNSGTAAQPSSSTTGAHGAPAGGGGGDADDHTSVVDLEALRKALEDACFSATGIHMTFDVCEGRAHTLTDESTKAHTGVSGEELAGGLQRSPRKQTTQGVAPTTEDATHPALAGDDEPSQRTARVHPSENPLDTASAAAEAASFHHDSGFSGDETPFDLQVANSKTPASTHRAIVDHGTTGGLAAGAFSANESGRTNNNNSHLDAPTFNLTEDQQQALNERGPITLVPEVIGKSISQTRIVDVPCFYQALNSRVGIITCIAIECIAGGVTMLPYHMQEQYWVDLTCGIGLTCYCVPHLMLGLTFYRDKCLMLLRSFEFWYMLVHCSFIAFLIGLKYVSAGVNPIVVWPGVCLGIPAFIASLMMDASPFPLLLRTFFNFFMCMIWLFWTVAMAESEVFYNDGVISYFGEQRSVGLFHSDLRVMYCSSAFTVALFFGRYVVNGLLGNEHALLKANLVRRPAPLQYMESSHDSPVMRRHSVTDIPPLVHVPCVGSPLSKPGPVDSSSAGTAFATRRGRRSTKILHRTNSRTSIEVTNDGAFFVM